MSQHERSIRGLRLQPEVSRSLFPMVQRLTGRPPLLKRDPSLPNDVRAMLVHPQSPKQPYEIHYRRGEEPVLEHLIAHEIGHIVRLHRVPEEQRLMPAMSAESRWQGAEQIMGELEVLRRRGLGEGELAALFVMWHEALCTQLGSFPADLRIEAWIREQYPGLRPIQQRSLLEEVGRNGPMFERPVMELTPPSIYRPTMVMNAAQAYQVAQFYDRPELMAPFERFGFADQGVGLARQVLDAQDQGHRSDVAAVNAWAEQLHLVGWFEWGHPNRTR